MAASVVDTSLFCSVLIFLGCCCAIELPNYIPQTGKCSAEKASQCLKERIEFYRPFIAKGVPELGIIPIEPLHVRFASLKQGGGAVEVKANFTDLVFHGFSNFTIPYVNIAKDWKKTLITLSVPYLRVECKYSLTGKVLLLPISGEGTAEGTIKNLVSKDTLEVQKISRNGHLYLNHTNPVYEIDVDGLTLRFNNLFNGRRLLGETMNKFLNENWRELFLDVRKSFDDTVNEFLLSTIKKVFDKYAWAELFDIDEEEFKMKFKNDIIYE